MSQTAGRNVLLGLGTLLALGLGLSCEGRRLPPRWRPGALLEVQIKDQTLFLEVAHDEASRRVGLKDRKAMPENRGMIFVYPRPDKLSFWMKETYLPLSIAFIDDQGKILQIEAMQPHDESRIASKAAVRYAVEVNQGWFQRHGIGVGDAFINLREKVSEVEG